MEDGTAINNGEENLGSLIRASIDMDGWISNEKTQLGAHESALVGEQDSNISSQPDKHDSAEGTSYSQFQPWSSKCCEKEFCGLEKWERSVSLVQSEYSPAATEMVNYAFDEVNCALEPRQHKRNFAEQRSEASREDVGNCITLEKTPEQIRYEDVISPRRQADSETVKNFNETNLLVKNSTCITSHGEIFQNLPSFQDAFRKNPNNPYLQAENQCQVTPAQKTMNCYKCRETIEPRDWIRSITAGADLTAVYHANCFYCDYCKGVLCTDQYYTFHQGKLICNFDFQMLTNLRKVTDQNQKRLVVLHSVKKGARKSVKISLEQKKILQQALRSKDRPMNVKKNP